MLPCLARTAAGRNSPTGLPARLVIAAALASLLGGGALAADGAPAQPAAAASAPPGFVLDGGLFFDVLAAGSRRRTAAGGLSAACSAPAARGRRLVQALHRAGCSVGRATRRWRRQALAQHPATRPRSARSCTCSWREQNRRWPSRSTAEKGRHHRSRRRHRVRRGSSRRWPMRRAQPVADKALAPFARRPPRTAVHRPRPAGPDGRSARGSGHARRAGRGAAGPAPCWPSS
jgi:hypothetical protein